jgi:hypothetical protein
MISDESLDPEPDRAGKDGERCDGNLSRTLTSATCVRPRKEGHDTSGGALRIAEIEVVRRGIVEIDRSLDEPQAEDAGIEVEIALGVARDSRDMMDAGSCKSHGKEDIRVSTEVLRQGNAYAAKEKIVTE